jgi:hypothetical protein
MVFFSGLRNRADLFPYSLNLTSYPIVSQQKEHMPVGVWIESVLHSFHFKTNDRQLTINPIGIDLSSVLVNGSETYVYGSIQFRMLKDLDIPRLISFVSDQIARGAKVKEILNESLLRAYSH